jgi:hypothetical protein
MSWWRRSPAAAADQAASALSGHDVPIVRLLLAWAATSVLAVAVYQSVIFAVLDGLPIWSSGLSLGYFAVNALLVFAFSALVYAVLGQWSTSQALAVGVVAMLILAHLGKMLTLNRPLYLTDLSSAGQVVALLPALARSLAGLLVALVLTLAGVVLTVVLGLRHPVRRPRAGERLVAGLLAVVVLAPVASWTRLISAGSHLDTDLRDQLWDGRSYFVQKGFVLASLLQLSLVMPSPEVYDEPAVKAALGRAGLPAHGVVPLPEDAPDIVLYLGEAMWDPTVLPVSFSQDPMPNFRRLLDGPVAGELRVPVFGGLTPQTEFEILTGLSTDYFPAGTVVYQRYLRRPLPSIATYLKQHGYHTTAVHTYSGWFWDRRNALPLLGFDRFVTIDDFVNPPMAGAFVSDEALVDRIITECASASPCFVFGISMTSHGSYDRALPTDQPIRITGNLTKASREALEGYATTLAHADRALGRLIRRFESWPRPVVVAGFGDHLPLLGSDFAAYRETGFRSRPITPEQQERTHTTPVFIWSNRPLPPQRLRCRATGLGAHLLQAAKLPVPATLAFAAHVDAVAPSPAILPKPLQDDWWLLHYDLISGSQYVANLDPLLGPGRPRQPELDHGPGVVQAARIEVVDYAPRAIRVGESHLPQADGSSAMWLRCRNASDRAAIELDGESLQTAVGAGGLLTAILPQAVLQQPGRHRLRAVDLQTRASSEEVELVVLSRSAAPPARSPAAKAPSMPRLVSWGPSSVEVGVPFNRQPDGSSALWFLLDDAPAHVTVTLDGRPLAVTVGTAGLVSAAVPELPRLPGRSRLVLGDGASGLPLAEAWLEVKPPARTGPR